jgi:hypothetical protein
MPDRRDLTADKLLVSQCQANDDAAWKQLHARLLDRAQKILHKALGGDKANRALVEELTVDTLSVLFVNKRLLEAFQTSDGTLDEFLDYLLNRAVNHYFQVRARRRRREVPLSSAIMGELVTAILRPGIEEELVERLTPAERKYYDWRRLPQAEEAVPCPFSAAYARQLQHRIVEKALGLLFPD